VARPADIQAVAARLVAAAHREIGDMTHALDASEQARLSEMVRAAEVITSGEIIVVVDHAAGTYRSAPVALGLAFAVLCIWPLIALTSWTPKTIFTIQLIVASALVLLLSLRHDWRIALTPRPFKRARAHEAAMREFLARGLTQTRERTGVLIYVALAERYAEVRADSGIAAKVDDEIWRKLVTQLIADIRADRLVSGLETAIGAVGQILAAHAPPRADDSDELPNKVIVI
jgi:putative membrane protein